MYAGKRHAVHTCSGHYSMLIRRTELSFSILFKSDSINDQAVWVLAENAKANGDPKFAQAVFLVYH